MWSVEAKGQDKGTSRYKLSTHENILAHSHKQRVNNASIDFSQVTFCLNLCLSFRCQTAPLKLKTLQAFSKTDGGGVQDGRSRERQQRGRVVTVRRQG